MGVDKEREDFEAEFSKIKSDVAFWLHTWDEEMQGYNHPVMCWFWYMWQAAKAQAVPEGFVLVPKEPTLKMSIAYQKNAIAPVSSLSISGYKAMIEAREPAND